MILWFYEYVPHIKKENCPFSRLIREILAVTCSLAPNFLYDIM